MSIYSKLIFLLNENQGYQNIEPFFTENNIIDYDSKASILNELSKLGHIKYHGGLPPSPMVYFISRTGNDEPREPQIIKDFYAMITIKGIESLNKPEPKPDLKNKNISIKLGDNANANFILDSPNSTSQITLNILDKLNQITKNIDSDSSLNATQKQKIVDLVEIAKQESIQGKLSKPTITDLITHGASVSSIGSLVLEIIKSVGGF
jgi:hypothetical protein